MFSRKGSGCHLPFAEQKPQGLKPPFPVCVCACADTLGEEEATPPRSSSRFVGGLLLLWVTFWRCIYLHPRHKFEKCALKKTSDLWEHTSNAEVFRVRVQSDEGRGHVRKFSCEVSVLVVQHVGVCWCLLAHRPGSDAQKLSRSLSKMFLYFCLRMYRHDEDVEADVRWRESLWLSDAPNEHEALQPSCFSSETLTHTPTYTPTHLHCAFALWVRTLIWTWKNSSVARPSRRLAQPASFVS